MRINKYSFPGLKFLEAPELDKSFFDCDSCLRFFDSTQSKPLVKSLFFLTGSAHKSVNKIGESIDSVFNVNLFKKNFSESYTILIPEDKAVLHIDLQQIEDFIRVKFFTLFNEINFITFDIYHPNDEIAKCDLSQIYYDGRNITLHEKILKDGFINKNELNGLLKTALAASMSLIMFLNFVDVETKIIGSSGKSLYIENEKVKNETNFNIKVLDKTWYTTVINSEGFPVRGHLRLQPVGEGRKDRKLIYIEPFEKNGYKREAGILKSKGLV